LSIGRSIGRFANLSREIVVRLLYRWPGSRASGNTLPQSGIGFSGTFQDPPFQGFSKLLMVEFRGHSGYLGDAILSGKPSDSSFMESLWQSKDRPLQRRDLGLPYSAAAAVLRPTSECSNSWKEQVLVQSAQKPHAPISIIFEEIDVIILPSRCRSWAYAAISIMLRVIFSSR
jgi:hypothetical protein